MHCNFLYYDCYYCYYFLTLSCELACFSFLMQIIIFSVVMLSDLNNPVQIMSHAIACLCRLRTALW